MPDFFISYNKADREWAEWIAGQLEKDGFSTVLQAWDFRPGCNFVLEMQKATEDSERTIAVLSPDFLTSLFTQLEWAVAFVEDPTGKERKLLPVRVRECKPGGLLKALSYIDLVDIDEEAARNALLLGVKIGRANPSSPPPFPNSHSTPPPESPRPRFPGALPPVWNVPQMRNPNFTGREKILTDLHENLNSGQRGTWIQALTGLGGKGKTSLAREFAYRYRSEYDLVWWVRASEPATLAMDYSGLAAELDLPQKDSPDQNAIVIAVKYWLEQNQKWLLIFDNAQEPDVIERFLPQGGGGNVIITSRNPNWASLAHPRDVEVFKSKEAVEFILKRTSQMDEGSAELLAEETGFLPLALEQAGAYIEETGISLSDYLIRFKKHRKTALERGKPADYADTVATTWEISFQAVKEKLPASADLLNLCAFLAPDDISKSLFLGGKDLPEPLASSTADEFAFDEIVAELRRYSLISGTGNKFSVHQLVQAVTRDRLSPELQTKFAGAAVRLINDIFPEDLLDNVDSWTECASLLPHALVVSSRADEIGVARDVAGHLFRKIGHYLIVMAEFNKAKKMLGRAIEIDKGVYGQNNSNVAEDEYYFGCVLHSLGDLASAEKHYEIALKIGEEVYDYQNPFVAKYLNKIGILQLDFGNPDNAIERLEKALNIYLKLYSYDSPKVAVVLNNIGRVHSFKGDKKTAKKYFQDALELYEKAYGSENRKVAVQLNNIGRILQDEGNFELAKEYFERSLSIFEKVFGLVHPHVAREIKSLGSIMWDSGKLSDAREYFERALAIEEKVYGLENARIAATASILGQILKDSGEPEKARECFERALRISQKSFGDNHHLTLTAKANLAGIESLKL